MIESYSFGKMVIDGREYRKDLMILSDGTVLDRWWRESGHVLTIRDLAAIVEASPSLLIVGTGMPGLMTPDATLLSDLREKGISTRVMPTAEAVREFNDFVARGKTCAACFHLTC